MASSSVSKALELSAFPLSELCGGSSSTPSNCGRRSSTTAGDSELCGLVSVANEMTFTSGWGSGSGSTGSEGGGSCQGLNILEELCDPGTVTLVIDGIVMDGVIHEVAGEVVSGKLASAGQKMDGFGVDSTEAGRLGIVAVQLTVEEVTVSDLCMGIPVDKLGGVLFCIWLTNARKLDHNCSFGTAESMEKVGSSDFGTASGRLP